MKTLDCSTIESTQNSLISLFKTDLDGLNKFLLACNEKITFNNGIKDCSLTFNDILTYFQLDNEEVLPDRITMFHLSSSVDDSSFKEHGLLNLENVIKKGLLNEFFLKNGIKIVYKEGVAPIITYKNKDYTDEHLFWRFNQDKCINGFLIREMAECNSNVQHLKKCPEFIHDLSRLLTNPDLVSNWIKENKRIKLSLSVDFKDLNNYDADILIVGAVEYLVLKSKELWSSGDNYMVYLDEDVNILPSDILRIEVQK